LGRTVEAGPLLARLDDMGYRDPQFAPLFAVRSGARGDGGRQAQTAQPAGRTRK
jgi:hypothetical protein